MKAGIQLDEMIVKGNYTLSSFFTKAEDKFTVILKNVFVKGNASLAVERDGRIRTKDIKMDISFKDMAMDFQNLGLSTKYFYWLTFYSHYTYDRFHGQHFSIIRQLSPNACL